MTINDFLDLDDAHEISSSQVQILNEELSRVEVTDIPKYHCKKVLDYVLCALNMEAVSSDIVQELEQLCLSLEDTVRQQNML